MTPLSHKQKRELSILAREAWMHAVERGDERDAEAFRHAEVASVVGKDGLRCCTQEDFAPLMAHFHGALGHAEATLFWQSRCVGNDRRIAWHRLVTTAAKTGLSLNYAGEICRHQFRVELESANARQLHCLANTLTARSKTRKDRTHVTVEV